MFKKFFIRIMRVIELIFVLPIATIIVWIEDKKFPKEFCKECLSDFGYWFKNGIGIRVNKNEKSEIVAAITGNLVGGTLALFLAWVMLLFL